MDDIELCCCVFLLANLQVSAKLLDPDFPADTRRLLTSRGYRCEEHEIVTNDRYILKVFRAYHPSYSPGRPVILQHGVLGSSTYFVASDPNGHANERKDGEVSPSLGIALLQQHYDVWLPNSRGTDYSEDHSDFKLRPPFKINPNPRFWNFSYSDMAKYDVPAVVDYVLSKTGRSDVAYIGHSQGTSIMFIALSKFARLNQQIKPFIALAPVAKTSFHASGLNLIEHIVGPLNYPILHQTPALRSLLGPLCATAGGTLCTPLYKFLLFEDPTSLNISRFPIYFTSFPAGTSSKDARHYAQNFDSKKFAEYDYGPLKNQMLYGSIEPPEYNLTKITNSEIYFIKGPADTIADPIDVNALRKTLGSKIKGDIVISRPRWGHLAVILAKEAGKYVNKPIIDILRKYD